MHLKIKTRKSHIKDVCALADSLVYVRCFSGYATGVTAMKCDYTYIKMKHSKNVEEHSTTLLTKLEKFLDRPLKGHFTFSKEGFQHKVLLTLTGKNIFFKAECESENFYGAIDEAIDKMYRQLEKKKSKMKGHKHKNPAKELNNLISLDEYRHTQELKRRLG